MRNKSFYLWGLIFLVLAFVHQLPSLLIGYEKILKSEPVNISAITNGNLKQNSTWFAYPDMLVRFGSIKLASGTTMYHQHSWANPWSTEKIVFLSHDPDIDKTDFDKDIYKKINIYNLDAFFIEAKKHYKLIIPKYGLELGSPNLSYIKEFILEQG